MISKIFKTATFKQSQITIISTLLNGVLGAFFFIIIARYLGPEDFGVLSIAVTVLTLVADISDFGVNTGIVKFFPKYFGNNKDKAYKFLKLGLEFKFIVSLFVILLGVFLSSLLASVVFKKPQFEIPLIFSSIGVGGALFFSYATSTLQSMQRFWSWGFINILTNGFRLLFVGVIILSSTLNMYNSLIIYIVFPFFGFFVATLLLPFKKIILQKNEFALSKEFFSFNVWVGIFSIISAISARMDVFLNARLLSLSEVGLYSAANQLAQFIPQFIGALGVVAAPKFASFETREKMIEYLKKFQLFTLGLAGIIVLLLPLAFYFIPVFYGNEYKDSIIPFLILVTAMCVFLISIPVHTSIIYYYSKPQIFVYVSVGYFLIVSFLGYFLISNFGIIGSALTVLLGTTFNFLMPLLWFLYKLKSEKT